MLFTHEGITYNGPDIIHQYHKLEKEVHDLRDWKKEMLKVEAEWSQQEVGELLGLVIGEHVRPNIAPGIRKLIDHIGALERSRESWVRISEHLGRKAAISDRLLDRIQKLVGAEHHEAIPTEIGSLQIDLVITTAIKNFLAHELQIASEIIEESPCQTHKKRRPSTRTKTKKRH